MAYQFKDATAQTYFETIVQQLKSMVSDPDTLPDNFEALTVFLPEIRAEFEPITPDSWPAFIRALALILITETIRYTPITQNIYLLEAPGIQAAYRSLVTTAYPATFKFSGNSGLSHQFLAELLTNQGFIESPSDEEIGFLSLEWEPKTSKYNPRDVKLPAIIRSILGTTKSKITDKEQLYFNLMALDPEVAGIHLARTRQLNEVQSISPGTVQIVRPVGPLACSGRGISLVTNNSELAAAKRKVRTFKSAIISEYIDPPLLWEGRKFHLRMYYLVRAAKRHLPFYSELWTRGTLMTAGLPYQSSNWQNPLIHDTHGKTTPRMLWFPEDLPDPSQGPAIFAQMETIMALVARIMEPSVTIYPESIYGYEVLGCDFMIDASYRVVLLEINDHVGYPKDDLGQAAGYTVAEFGKDYDYWIYERVIRPIYFPNAPPINLPRFV